MAVEAPHMTLFPSQLLPNREMIGQPNATTYNDLLHTAYGTTMEKVIPMYAAGMTDSFLLPTPNFKADSGVTSRKRPRFDQSSFTFLSEDIASHIYQQQIEIDRFISHHTEKVRTEIEEMRRRNSRRLIALAEEGITKKLKAKEEEIAKIGQLNWSLEEKVKSLHVENQIWRELAQTNEATANALRNNLQQVLTQLQLQQQQYTHNFTDNAAKTIDSIDDAQSHCGSNYEEDKNENENQIQEQQRMLAGDSGGGERRKRWCRNCGKKESCVLLLPCRHLCICTICASAITVCPVCKSTKSAGVHVNMN